MKTILVYDPPMCCSSGVCGPDVDPLLPRFAGMLGQLENFGVTVERHNLAQEPVAFAQNRQVRAILLLDATQSHHRELGRQTRSNRHAEEVEKLLPRLRDPDFTRVLLVTLAESTPVHEAAALQNDLRRAEIEPHVWIVNQSPAALPAQ